MRCAIIGDREVSESDFKLIEDAVKASGFDITSVVSGGAKGADTLAKKWAKTNNIPFTEYKADWNDLSAPDAMIREGKFGKYDAKAGFRRNQTIIDNSDCVIALQPNGETDGTADSIGKAKKKQIPIFIFPERSIEHSAFAYEF